MGNKQKDREYNEALEMKYLRRIGRITRMDRIKNKVLKERLKLEVIQRKIFQEKTELVWAHDKDKSR